MIWIARSEKDTNTAALEKRLWDAADQFRANSGLKSQEYSAPVLGLIFLHFAEIRFAAGGRLHGRGFELTRPGHEKTFSRQVARAQERPLPQAGATIGAHMNSERIKSHWLLPGRWNSRFCMGLNKLG